MKKEYVYRGFERFWHWTQAVLIIFLGVTGFEIHGSLRFFGYDQAVRYHNTAAISFLILIAFAIFWHFTTGEWRQISQHGKICGRKRSIMSSDFRNAPHPTKKTVLNKLNPLRSWVCRTQGARHSGDGYHRSSLYVLPLSAAIRSAKLKHRRASGGGNASYHRCIPSRFILYRAFVSHHHRQHCHFKP